MAKLLKLRRGTTSQHNTFTGAEGEVTIDTTKDTAVVHDGSTAGGRPLAREDMSNVSSSSIAGRLGADSIATTKIAGGALPTDVTVASANIVNGTIVNADLANDCINSSKIADNSINSEHYVDGSIDRVHLAADIVDGSKIANDSINSEHYVDGSIDNAHLANNSVSYSKMGDISTNSIMGRISSGSGDPQTLSASQARTILNVENGATADQSASEILTLIKTVDGSGSGLDADTLDGVSSGSFVRSDAADTLSGTYNMSANSTDVLNFSSSSTNDSRGIAFNNRTALSADHNDGYLRLNQGSEFSNGVYTPGVIRADGGFHVDGSASIDSSGNIVASKVPTLNQNTTGNATTATRLQTARTIGGTSFNGTANITPAQCTNSDTVDNLHASSFLRSDTGDTASGDITFSGGGGAITLSAGSDIRSSAGNWTGEANKIQWHSSHVYIQSADKYIFRKTNGTEVLIIDGSGNLTADGNVTAYSDARLKTDISTINDALGICGKLRGVSYKWIKNNEPGIGVIAQEVEQVIPEVVLTNVSTDPATGEETEVKSVDYGKIVGVLINAINELKAEVDELKGGK